MPRYDYKCNGCGYETELVHSVTECDDDRYCKTCGCPLTRCINAPHVEGSSMYPFKLWNIRLPKGQFSKEITSKGHHKEVLASRNLDSPAITKWGKRRVTV